MAVYRRARGSLRGAELLLDPLDVLGEIGLALRQLRLALFELGEPDFELVLVDLELGLAAGLADPHLVLEALEGGGPLPQLGLERRDALLLLLQPVAAFRHRLLPREEILFARAELGPDL